MTYQPPKHAAALLGAFRRFAGYSYGALDHAKKTVDCCVVQALVVVDLYSADPDYTRVRGAWWKRANLWRKVEPRPDENLRALAEVMPGTPPVRNVLDTASIGALRRTPDGWVPPPGACFAAQGWSKLVMPVDGQDDAGHTFAIVVSEDEPGMVWVVQSTLENPYRNTIDGVQVSGLAESVRVDAEAWPQPMPFAVLVDRYRVRLDLVRLPDPTSKKRRARKAATS